MADGGRRGLTGKRLVQAWKARWRLSFAPESQPWRPRRRQGGVIEPAGSLGSANGTDGVDLRRAQ